MLVWVLMFMLLKANSLPKNLHFINVIFRKLCQHSFSALGTVNVVLYPHSGAAVSYMVRRSSLCMTTQIIRNPALNVVNSHILWFLGTKTASPTKNYQTWHYTMSQDVVFAHQKWVFLTKCHKR